ncbi:toll/interleukin-1 receptor domain-containing protein [Pectobacterium carotovorum]|uniref:toll/interleukin-1 receptor domain-containing protein n=1 Tax=Pectobacterium carotovorum TaxID=554 RepID=UPI001CF46DD3|nr:toll/interleukin-1 receptor domain-containing protein [Pectobacterium carotovorum]MCA6969807.1 toll/interleukin-1 receptor domain-containing protein [Pectobacterium carotovorum]MCH4996755.1 toll/interleukin-1 receptor domain-containing protein [Pectobacterium carotovorum]
MKTDLFISYAWTSNTHREWVHLFASQLHLAGYVVKIDEAVDYGSSLNGFMQEVIEASHVLLIIDENYVERANNNPDSGVGIETKWISEVFANKSAKWLSVIFVQNPERKLPNWLNEHNPKGFDFNSNSDRNEFPGSIQIDAIWRWIEGLPADKSHAIPLSVLRKRAARLERIDTLRDPANYTNPALNGRETFCYRHHAHYTVGNGEYQFKIAFSGCSQNSVHLYIDGGLKAVGLITAPDFDPLTVESFLTSARDVSPIVGQKAVLLNSDGALCVITIDEVQREINTKEYVPEHVTFSYEILDKH